MTFTESTLRTALAADPRDAGARAVLADYLEDAGRPGAALFHRQAAAGRLWPFRHVFRQGRGRPFPDPWWEWWCNRRAAPALCPPWYVPQPVFALLGGETWTDGDTSVKRCRRLEKALALMELAYAAND